MTGLRRHTKIEATFDEQSPRQAYFRYLEWVPGMMKSYLTIQEVARHFGINVTTVYRLAQKGALPAFKIGNQWRFSPAMLEVWITDQVNYDRVQKEKDNEQKKSDPRA